MCQPSLFRLSTRRSLTTNFTNKTGLFGLYSLYEPKDLLRLSDEAINASNKLLKKIEGQQGEEASVVLDDMDRISDIICR